MADHSKGCLGEFATQAVSNTLWGCAVLNFYDADLYNAVAADILGACGTHPTHACSTMRAVLWDEQPLACTRGLAAVTSFGGE